MTKPLELHIILDKVRAYAHTDTVREAILALSPMTDVVAVNGALDDVEETDAVIRRLGTWPILPDFDINDVFDEVSGGRVLSIREILVVLLFLKMERDVKEHLAKAMRLDLVGPLLQGYKAALSDHGALRMSISSKIDDDGVVFDDATVELSRIRKSLKRLDKSLQDRLHKLLSDLSAFINEPVITIRNDRFCLPVKEAFKNKVKGVVHDVSSSRQTVYVEPEATRGITAEIEALRVAEEREIEAIILALSEEIRASSETLRGNLDVFLSMDFIQSKALYAKETDAVRPSVNTSMTTTLVKARHPLIDPAEVVPIDVTLDDRQKILMITGPNTGGKTVALKTVGLLTLMTQCGIPIPASPSSDVALFDSVFADIGDEQSIQQSLSTFSSHMRRIIMMLENLEDNSLILLDEIGSGTDPNEGVALAIAIIDAFRKKDVRMMVTTHYSELKSHAYQEEGMFTASVAFDKETLKPLYHLMMGTTGASHAFLIARRLGLPEDVVSRARELYKGRQTDLQKMMERLNDDMVALEEERKRHQDETEALMEAKRSYEDAADALEKSKEHTLKDVRLKEEKKWAKLVGEAKDVLETLKTKSLITKPELAEMTHRLRGGKDSEEEPQRKETFRRGDTVFIVPYQQTGVVTRASATKVRVKFGKFDLDFKPSDLRLDREGPNRKPDTPEPETKPSSGGSTPAREGRYELDLRGFRYDDVAPALDAALDKAMLSSLKTMRIIHGFGTGAVRQAVHAYIKRSPYVESHRFGGEGEGLNGVTIVTLK